MIRPAFRDDLARVGGASAGPIRVRSFGLLHGGADASREDCDAPGARSASFDDRPGRAQRDCRRVGVAPSTVRLTLKRVASAELNWPLTLGYRLPSRPIVREAMSELHRVGVNLSQIARHANARHARLCRAARHPGRAQSAVRYALDL